MIPSMLKYIGSKMRIKKWKTGNNSNFQQLVKEIMIFLATGTLFSHLSEIQRLYNMEEYN